MKDFMRRLGIKIIKTASQAGLGYLSGAAVIQDINWGILASTMAVASLLCVLMNLSQLEEE